MTPTLRYRNFSYSLFFCAVAILLSLSSLRADHIKVFLLGGQSNMVGYGTDSASLPVALQSPQADVRFYHGSSLMTLRPGSGRDFGPEVTFGRTIADAFPSENFGLIKYAVSGSDLVNAWDKDTGTVYANFRTKVADGLAALTSAGHTYEITGMLWTQGERDARIGRTTAQYEADLIEFIADIRTRYGANLPFFLNRLSTGQTDLPDITKVRAAQENVAAADTFAFLIDADGMSFHDDLHFDAAGQIALGEAFGQSYVNSLAPDTTDPSVSALNPAHGATDVPVDAQLEISFNEAVAFGSGFITLKATAGGTVVERYDVANPPANLTLGGSKITITPSSDFSYSSAYHVEVDATAVDDLAGNSFAGFSDDLTWSFTTAASDPTEPTVTTLSPANGSSGVSVSSNLEITFNETIALESGFIRIRDNGGTLIEAFDVASSSGLSLNGSTVTITPGSPLSFSTHYYVEIEATAIDDLSGNSFAGFSASSNWSFTTTDEPTAITYGDGVSGTETEVNDSNTEAYSADVSDADLINGLTPTFVAGDWLNGRDPTFLVNGAHGAGNDNTELTQAESPPATMVFDLGTGDNGFGYNLTSLVSIAAWGNNGFGNQVWTFEVAGVGADGSLTSTDFSTIVSADYTPLGSSGGSTKVSVDGLSGTLTEGVQFIRITSEVNPDGTSNRFTWREFDVFGASTIQDPGLIGFVDWIGGFGLVPADQDFSDDPDGDGLTNGVEAFFGTNPATSNSGLSLDALDTATVTLSHPNPDGPLDGLIGRYKWSPDLATWYASDGIEGDGSNTVTAVATPDSPVNNTTTVSATIGGPVLDKLFIQVEVSQEP